MERMQDRFLDFVYFFSLFLSHETGYLLTSKASGGQSGDFRPFQLGFGEERERERERKRKKERTNQHQLCDFPSTLQAA